MAEFNPNIPQQQLPQVTSRGSLPDTSLSGIFSDISTTGQAEITGINDILKDRISNEVRQGSGHVRDIFTGQADLPSYLGGVPEPEGLNAEGLADYRRRVQELTQAYRTGNLQESHYWLLQDMEARRVRGRYPGQREEVDQIIERYLGATPANRLAVDLRREAAVGAGRDAQQRQWLEHQAMTHGIPEAQRIYSNNPPTNQELALGIYQFNRQRIQFEEARTRLEVEHFANRNVSERAVRVATADLTTQFANVFDTAAQAFGGADGITRRIEEAVRNPPTAQRAEELRSMWAQVRSSAERQFRERIATSPGDGPSWSTLIGNPELTNNIVQDQLRRFDAIGEAITNQHWGYLGAIHSHLQRIREGDQVSVLENSDVIRRFGALSQILGQQAFGQIMLANNSRDVQTALIESMRLSSNLLQLPGTTERHGPRTLNQIVSEIEGNTTRPVEERNRILATTLDTTLRALGRTDQTPENIARAATGLFSPDSRDTLTRVANTEQIYSQISSEATALNMIRIQFSHPEIYRNYRQWVLDQFPRLTVRMAGDLQNIALTDTRGQLRQDPATGLFSIERADPSVPVSPASQQSVDRFNNVIRGVTALMNAEGVSTADRDRVMSTVMQNINQRVNLNVTRQGNLPTPTNIWDSIMHWYHPTTAPANITPPHVAPLLDFLGAAEGGRHGYNSSPTAGGSAAAQVHNADLTNMTLTQVMEHQRGLLNQQREGGITDSALRTSAVGRFQINRETLRSILESPQYAAERERLGITANSRFDNETQNRLAIAMLNVRGGLQDFLTGRISRETFQNRVASIWAGSPTTTGESRYSGVGRNRVQPGANERLQRVIDDLVASYNAPSLTTNEPNTTSIPVQR